jgi:RNA polymerase sigma-70 factor (ECF subfamily)
MRVRLKRPKLPDSDTLRLDLIMQRYAAGEAAAFRELYDALAPRLRRFCMRLSRQRIEVDDLFQDALLRLHRARASYVAGAHALGWVCAIARSAYWDRLRRNRQCPEDLLQTIDLQGEVGPLISCGSSPESYACARDIQRVVDRELRRMSEKPRRAYSLLREEEGLSISETAVALGVSCVTAKQRAHRACQQIRAALRAEGWGGGRGMSKNGFMAEARPLALS